MSALIMIVSAATIILFVKFGLVRSKNSADLQMSMVAGLLPSSIAWMSADLDRASRHCMDDTEGTTGTIKRGLLRCDGRTWLNRQSGQAMVHEASTYATNGARS